MNIGAMDRRIAIQQSVETQDGIGHPVATWSTLATVWADVKPISGSEAARSDRLVASKQARFFIRYIAGLKPKMRIQYENEIYNITYIRELGRREGIEMLGEVPEV